MLAECYALVHTLEETAAPLSEPMREVVAKLTGLKNALQDQLGDLQLGGAVTPDKAAAGLAVLKRHQGQLDKIDAERLKHGGVFGGDVAAGAVPCGQALAASLLAEAYALVEEIQAIVVKE